MFPVISILMLNLVIKQNTNYCLWRERERERETKRERVRTRERERVRTREREGEQERERERVCYFGSCVDFHTETPVGRMRH